MRLVGHDLDPATFAVERDAWLTLSWLSTACSQLRCDRPVTTLQADFATTVFGEGHRHQRRPSPRAIFGGIKTFRS